MKKILLISSQLLPIPAIKGGAVETLITNLIDENEIHGKVKFFIISSFDKAAKKYFYRNTKVYYVKKNNVIDLLAVSIKNFLLKIVFNKFTKRLFKEDPLMFYKWSVFGHQSYRIAKKIKPDIIISESYDQLNRLWPISKKYNRNKLFYHLHYVKEENMILRDMFPNTIAISKFVMDRWVKTKNVGGAHKVIYNGIDLTLFSKIPDTKQRNEFRRSLGINDSDFVVVFSGRLRPHKGILRLLNAFQMINDSNVKLLVLGEFLSETNRDNNGREIDFEQKCKSIIANNKNIIRLGKVSYSNMPSYYHISDVQCIPSMWEEGAGLICIEGMACGLPLIITNSGGMTEYTGNECAIILDRDESLEKNIVSSILFLKSNPTVCNAMSKAGIERSRMFSKEKYYMEYIDFLLEGREKTNE